MNRARPLTASLALVPILVALLCRPALAGGDGPSRAGRAARRWSENPSARSELFLERGWTQSACALAMEFLEVSRPALLKHFTHSRA